MSDQLLDVTAILKKLTYKRGQRLLLLGAPTEYVARLAGSATVVIAPEPNVAYDLVQAFVQSKADVDATCGTALAAAKPAAAVWFTYPKGRPAAKADLTRDQGWDALTAARWRPVSVFSVDASWSALRFRPVADVRATPNSRFSPP